MPFGSIALALGLGAAGSIAGGALASRGASRAARTQAEAADRAAQLQFQAQQEALQFERERWQQSLGLLQPWWQAGAGALGNLSYLMGIPGGGGFQFPGTAQQQQFAPPQQDREAVLRSILQRLDGRGNGRLRDVLDLQRMSDGSFGLRNPAPALPPAPGEPLPFEGRGPSPMSPPGVSPAGPEGFGGFPGRGRLPAGPSGPAGPAGPGPAAAGVPPAQPPGLAGLGEFGEFGSLLRPYTDEFSPERFSEEFVAPDVTEDPGYQFRLQQGMEALERSAAARGGVLTGATARAIQDYAQGLASQEYQSAYARRLGEYQQRYGIYSDDYQRALTEYQQAYNIFQQNQANIYNRLAGLAGMGQTSAGQLSSAGQAGAGRFGNLLLGGASNIANAYQQAAAARASGQVASGNIWGNVLGQGFGSLRDILLWQGMQG